MLISASSATTISTILTTCRPCAKNAGKKKKVFNSAVRYVSVCVGSQGGVFKFGLLRPDALHGVSRLFIVAHAYTGE